MARRPPGSGAGIVVPAVPGDWALGGLRQRLRRAGVHLQLAQRLLGQADRHRGVRALARVDPDHHFCHQRTPAVRTGPGDRGGHAQLQCWRSRPFRATPRHGPAGWHLVIKPGHQRDRQADREPSPPRPFNATARLTTIPARSATPQVSIRRVGARSLASYPSLSVILSIGITLRPTEPSVPSIPDWRLAAVICWQT